MRPISLVVIALMLVGSGDARAAGGDPPLFAAFKTFCVATGADLYAVKRTVEQAGAKVAPVSHPWLASPANMWDYVVGGEPMLVSALEVRLPAHGPHPALSKNFCKLDLVSNGDDASVEAIKNWIGVPRSVGTPTLSLFVFQEVNGVRSPLPKDRVTRDLALRKGQVREIWLTLAPNSASVEYINQLPVPPVQNAN
jgi:hypothetical protein